MPEGTDPSRFLGFEMDDAYGNGPGEKSFRLLLTVLIGFTLVNYLYHGLFRPLFTDKADFEAYYNAALALRYGGGLYDLMLDFFREGPAKYDGPLPYVYPPAFAIFLTPLAYVDFRTAVLIWIFMDQVLFLGGVWLLMRAISPRYSWLKLAAILFVCMNFRPLFIDVLLGQINVLLFFLMVLGLYFYRSGKDIHAGIALAMASMIKVIPFFLLGYFLWKRAYKVFLAGVFALLVLFLYSLLFFDFDLYVWYFKFMGDQSLFNAYHDNHSLTGFVSRMLVRSMWAEGIIDHPTAAHISIIMGSLVILAAFLFVTRKRLDRKDERFLHEYGLAVITMLLLSKMTSTPYLVMLLVPLSIWVTDVMDRIPPPKWLVPTVAAYGVMAVWYPLPVGKFLNMETYEMFLKGIQVNIFSIQFFALCIFWFYFVHRIAKTETGERSV